MSEVRYLSVRQAAEVAQVCEYTIRRWIKEGRLPATKPGGKSLRIAREELDRLLGGAK
jgi:excisionase family DNA binding protein